MRFIDTKRFSPTIYLGDVPMSTDLYFIDPQVVPKKKEEFIAFKNNRGIITDEAWWWKQRERCINGFTVENVFVEGGDVYVDGWNIEKKPDGTIYIPDLDLTIENGTIHITGRHYFYLNFWWIKGYNPEKKRKTLIHPRFTDLSWENWIIRDRMISDSKNNLWGKCRQRGISEEEACDTAYQFLFYPDSQSVILGGDEKYNENTMGMVRRGIERLRNTQFFKWRESNRKEYMKTDIFGSEVYSRTCKTNVQAASGLSPSSVKFEEIGIWKKGFVKDAYEFVQPSQEAEGYKTGWSQFIGTAGDDMDDGVDDMQDMFYDPASFNLLEFADYYEGGNVPIARFIPAWKFELIDEDGNSQRKESIAKIEAERKRKSAAARLRFITQKPLIPSEMFYIGKGGFFGETIRQWCNERIAYIKTHREAQVEKRYILEWKDETNYAAGVKATPDEEGWCYIVEHPQEYEAANQYGQVEKLVYDNLYKVATDSYDQDEANTSSSKGFCSVKKGFINADSTYRKYVAYCLERPETSHGGSEKFYEYTALMTAYYNGINLIEYSKIRIIDWYKKKGLHYLMKLRPQMAIAKMVQDSVTQNTYGIDPATKPHWLAMQKDFLSKRDNIENCDSIVILQAWAKFRYDPSGKKYNCDITIGTSLCTVLEDDEMEIVVAKQAAENNNNEPVGHYYSMNNGQINANY